MRLWIYNDASCAALLKNSSELFQGQAPKFVVEVASAPNFEYYFGFQSPAGFPGICGILSQDLTLDDIAVSVNEAHPKIIFAPNSGAPASLLGSALANLSRDESLGKDVELFVEVSLVPELIPWLSATTEIGVVLDLSVAPEKEFVDSMQLLTERELITSDRWIGLKIYDSRDGSFDEADESKLELLGLAKISKASILS